MWWLHLLSYINYIASHFAVVYEGCSNKEELRDGNGDRLLISTEMGWLIIGLWTFDVEVAMVYDN